MGLCIVYIGCVCNIDQAIDIFFIVVASTQIPWSFFASKEHVSDSRSVCAHKVKVDASSVLTDPSGAHSPDTDATRHQSRSWRPLRLQYIYIYNC